jgi:hypothetical protein
MAKKFSLKQSTGRARVFQVADSTNRIDISTNADYVGGAWVRDDVGAGAWHFALNTTRCVIQYAAPAVNPITNWVDVMVIPVGVSRMETPGLYSPGIVASPTGGEGGEIQLLDSDGSSGWTIDNAADLLRMARGSGIQFTLSDNEYGTVVLLSTPTAGGQSWMIQSTGGTAAQGQGKLIIRNSTTGEDVIIISADGSVVISGDPWVWGSGGSAIVLAHADPATGAWIRNDGTNTVLSTHVGNLHLGFGGNAAKVIHIGNGASGALQVAGNAPAGSLVIAADGTISTAHATPFTSNAWTNVTPLAGWNTTGGEGVFRARLTKEGFVSVECGLYGSGTSTDGTMIGTLPSGMDTGVIAGKGFPIATVGKSVASANPPSIDIVGNSIYIYNCSGATSLFFNIQFARN